MQQAGLRPHRLLCIDGELSALRRTAGQVVRGSARDRQDRMSPGGSMQSTAQATGCGIGTRTRSKSSKNLPPYLAAFSQQQRDRGLDEKTVRATAGDLRWFQATVRKDLAQVTRDDLRRALLLCQQTGAAHSSIQRRASSLRSFYDYLFGMGFVAARPTANLQLPKGWERVPRAPAAEDLERVIAAIGCEAPLDLRDRAVLLLLRDSGLRETALSRICVSDVDWQNLRVTLRHDKFGKQHPAPLSLRAVEALREYLERARPLFVKDREVPYLFPGVVVPYRHGRRVRHGGDHLCRQHVYNIAKRWTKQVLGVAYSPHRWRAAFLTEGAAKGMDALDLMNLAGHASPEITERYIRHQIGHLKERYYATHPRAGRKP